MGSYRFRRLVVVVIVLLVGAVPLSRSAFELPTLNDLIGAEDTVSVDASRWPDLSALAVKGRAPKTGYSRDRFGDGWESTNGCTTRNRILARDMTHVVMDEQCRVESGLLNDPYTGKQIEFHRGETTSDDVQIDHVVALSNAWQTGAQQFAENKRIALANDPQNLLAVDGDANQQKSDGDAATWLPANKAFRCAYVRRQIAVKTKYDLWVTPAERNAMARVLDGC